MACFMLARCCPSTTIVSRDDVASNITSVRYQKKSPNMCREELENYDAFDEGVFCRSRFWLFLSYVVSFASVIGAAWVLLQVQIHLKRGLLFNLQPNSGHFVQSMVSARHTVKMQLETVSNKNGTPHRLGAAAGIRARRRCTRGMAGRRRSVPGA